MLRPCPPAEAQLRALGRLHRRQAWLCLRNMAHMPENEAVRLQSPLTLPLPLPLTPTVTLALTLTQAVTLALTLTRTLSLSRCSCSRLQPSP